MSDSDSTITHSSVSTYNDRKKRKNNLSAVSSDNDKPAERSNRNHTAFFFRKDSNNDEITYCIVCERTNRNPYPYSRKGGSTSNLAGHLRDKHGITKKNYSEYLDANNEVRL